MSDKDFVISKRLSEVRERQEAAYREVSHLPIDQALKEILKKARLAAAEYHFPTRRPRRMVRRDT